MSLEETTALDRVETADADASSLTRDPSRPIRVEVSRLMELFQMTDSGLRSLVRTVIKKVNAAVDSGDAEAAKAAYANAVPVIDRMADKGIIHKNKAARHKSRLNAQVKALAA